MLLFTLRNSHDTDVLLFGNHLATQGFLGWFQCAERKKKSLLGTFVPGSYTTVFIPWSEHVGLHLLCSWLQRVAVPLPSLSHGLVMLSRSLSQSSQARSAVGGFYFDHLTEVSPYGFLSSPLANGAAYVFLVTVLHRVSLASVSVDGFCSFSNWTSSYCHTSKVLYTF